MVGKGYLSPNGLKIHVLVKSCNLPVFTQVFFSNETQSAEKKKKQCRFVCLISFVLINLLAVQLMEAYAAHSEAAWSMLVSQN